MAENKPPRGPGMIDDDELKNTMGSYFGNATRVPGEQFQPQRPPAPKNPAEQAPQVCVADAGGRNWFERWVSCGN